MKAFRALSRVLLMASLVIAGLAIVLHRARACSETPDPCCRECEEEPPTEFCVPTPSDCDEQTSSAPIRYLDGVLKYKSPGLHIDGPGRGFSLRLGFNNHPHGVIDTDFGFGVNWWLEGVPFLEWRPNGNLMAVWGAMSVAEFAPAGAGEWEGLHGAKAGIAETTDGQETVFAMQGVYGTKAVFHHLDHPDPEKKGKAKKIVTPVGKEITFTYNLYGVDWIVDTNAYTWDFAYTPGGLLESVEILDGAVSLGLMEMEYYGYGARWGLSRDLKKVTVTEYTSSGSAVTKTAYYAYHTDAYLAHRLRFVLDPETYAAASQNGQLDLDIAYDEADDFRAVADYEFDYYTSGANYLRVSSEKVRSAGCDCGAGRETGVFLYAYTLQAENAQNPYNNWVTQVVQTNPDLTKKIVRVNKIGAPIDVITEVTVDETRRSMSSPRSRWMRPPSAGACTTCTLWSSVRAAA